MINLIRTKEHRWIFQKNISSSKLMIDFLHANSKLGNVVSNEKLLENLKTSGKYKGRSSEGSSNTMGVRLSEFKFYMFAYSLPEHKNKVIPSPMATGIMRDDSKENVAKMCLINLFSLQFPHPFSNTKDCFKINAGRLIVKLLTDSNIDKKLYIDEFCYFLPFIETINDKTYNELIQSILEFRKLNFIEKENIFKSIKNYNDVFSNVFHEFNHYFFRMFRDFEVLNIIEDKEHNDGNIFLFIHGNSETKRSDAYDSRKKTSGYIKLSDSLMEIAQNLVDKFSAFDAPITQADKDILSREDFILRIYQTKPLKYMSILSAENKKNDEVAQIIDNMVHMSKYGSRDGKDFEKALKPVFELFEQVENVSMISGPDDTDLLCAVRENDDTFYKINVDGKTSSHATPILNPIRLRNHLKKHNSKYCIVVSSRFARGANSDINEFPIVAITAQALANYCLNGYNASDNGFVDYSIFDKLVQQNIGKNITNEINEFVNERYGL